MTSSGNPIYHEKQSLELCAVHALNNVFQEKLFTKSLLDEICVNLAPDNWFNPHRSILGLGNYDINVIMRAVELQTDCEVIWFDKRKDPGSIDPSKISGLILNVPNTGIFAFKRHWISVKQINDVFYNLDSKLKKPEEIGNFERLVEFLRAHIAKKDNELFLIQRRSSEVT